MNIQDLVVHVPPHVDGPDHGVKLAFDLAKRQGAYVTALVDEVRLTSFDSPSATSEADERLRQEINERSRHQAQRLSHAVATAAEAAGIRHEVVIEPALSYQEGQVFADYLRVRALGIIGVNGALEGDIRLVVETALFETGRPVLLVPPTSSALGNDRVMVAWDATPASVHAVTAAMPFLRAAREVVVAHVTDDKAFQRGRSGVELCHHLSRHGVQTQFAPVQRGERDVADALLEATRVHDVGLLVMGAYAHSALRRLIFGSATRGMFERSFDVPILMAN
ncbi:universal stress protein [Microvirga guangxiensis]|uniref:Universal stress protein family protein n=1 Tax=Microvirga guangxiensis TaxID=549386 RepID=A0A1G5KBK4_9HYPH|nr:universal stress protein [Microvirga guangxiensis]SCY97631.1 Universal stress protein family protein [Microvirga guangxiensis]